MSAITTVIIDDDGTFDILSSIFKHQRIDWDLRSRILAHATKSHKNALELIEKLLDYKASAFLTYLEGIK